jgi:hypothetical protein
LPVAKATKPPPADAPAPAAAPAPAPAAVKAEGEGAAAAAVPVKAPVVKAESTAREIKAPTPEALAQAEALRLARIDALKASINSINKTISATTNTQTSLVLSKKEQYLKDLATKYNFNYLQSPCILQIIRYNLIFIKI